MRGTAERERSRRLARDMTKHRGDANFNDVQVSWHILLEFTLPTYHPYLGFQSSSRNMAGNPDGITHNACCREVKYDDGKKRFLFNHGGDVDEFRWSGQMRCFGSAGFL